VFPPACDAGKAGVTIGVPEERAVKLLSGPAAKTVSVTPTDVKPESEAVLQEIGKLLQQNSRFKLLYVVGHRTTSEIWHPIRTCRSGARTRYGNVLTSKYSVAAARLHAADDGSTAPVESNDAEEARAKNRRVELVKQ
jgi:OOP family OmpA-OmpF porin